MKRLLLCVAVLGLLGCGGAKRSSAMYKFHGFNIWEVCLNGVVWYKTSGVLEEATGRDGEVILCEEKTYE